MAALAVAYAATAQLGSWLGAVDGVAASVCLPAGIALVAVLRCGYRIYPGIVVGAFVANVSAGVPLLPACVIAAGNTLEAFCAAYLLQEVAGFHGTLDRIRDVLSLVVLGALVSSCSSATIGVTAAWWAGVVPPARYFVAWWIWWLGDSLGILLVGAVVLVWSSGPRIRSDGRALVEAGALLLLLTFACVLVFGTVTLRSFAIFPFVVWAALRFGQPGVTVTCAVISAIAVWGNMHGTGPFATDAFLGSLASVQGFMGVLTVTGLVLGAAITERRESEDRLRATEEHFRLLIENGLDLISVLGADGTFHYASPSNVRVLGYRPDELIGRTAFDLVHPDDVPEVSRVFATAIRHPGVTPTVEFRFRHKDGSWRHVAATGNNLLHQRGIDGVVINARDITERKQAEQALHTEAEIAGALARVGRELIVPLDRQALLDRLSQVTTEVLGCDSSHTILEVPDTDQYCIAAGFGYPPEQWEWLSLVKMPKAIIDHPLASLESADVMQVGSADFSNETARAAGQHLGFTALLFMPLRRGDALIGFHVAGLRGAAAFTAQQERMGQGIGQLASLALENARLLQELAQASRLKSDFVATMSHELRTPLNVIVGYTDLMLDGAFGVLTDEQQQCVQRIDASSRELHDLINATLDLSRIESGRAPVELRDTSVADLIADVDRETQDLRRHVPLQFQWAVAADLPCLRTDPSKVKVVLKNLIGNAVKFTPTGQVSVDARSCEDGVEVSVTDTGIGMAPESLSIIFEPFRQVDSSSTRRYGGVGLGLYIVRRLLELVGGTITVSSEVGRGSTFRVRLPRAPQAA